MENAKDAISIAVGKYPSWRKLMNHVTANKCLAGARWVLKSAGLHIPQSNVDYPGMYAISCGKTLAKNPEKWGWKCASLDSMGNPPDGSLVFFKGRVGKPAGHVGIYKNERLYDNNGEGMLTPGWKKRLAYCFLPAESSKT